MSSAIFGSTSSKSHIYEEIKASNFLRQTQWGEDWGRCVEGGEKGERPGGGRRWRAAPSWPHWRAVTVPSLLHTYILHGSAVHWSRALYNETVCITVTSTFEEDCVYWKGSVVLCCGFLREILIRWVTA